MELQPAPAEGSGGQWSRAAPRPYNAPSARMVAVCRARSQLAVCLLRCSLLAVQFAFATLFGIGRTQSFRLCGDLGLNPYQKLSAIPDSDFEAIKTKIETTFEPKHAVLKRIGRMQHNRQRAAMTDQRETRMQRTEPGDSTSFTFSRKAKCSADDRCG